jgi:hypothetical protein
MKPALRYLALLLVTGCAGPQRDGEAVELPGHPEPTPSSVVAVHEVRLPADPYTSFAMAQTVLHELGGQVCGRRYRIVDRRMDWSVAAPASSPSIRAYRPGGHQAYDIVARIECLRAY